MKKAACKECGELVIGIDVVDRAEVLCDKCIESAKVPVKKAVKKKVKKDENEED